ncbi:hypothetical protein BDD12DRAFT_346313 [Trichophaea hybrida]|nr:hypothetical protein BDD12DRAFT_346313 [Trichophaea hybrida]
MVQRCLSSSGNQDSHAHDHRNAPHHDQSQVYQDSASLQHHDHRQNCVFHCYPNCLHHDHNHNHRRPPRPRHYPRSPPIPRISTALHLRTILALPGLLSPQALLCRDFTGSGAIVTSVFSYSISCSVGQDSYIVDWDIQNQIDCCNRYASVPLG